ncbi:MAG TPA: alcohol dehydrogenase catalytic domain-containing protein [Actinomycetota bacterium]|nr:alcohol dehydrogenase catalytic domain-containing protein [Actinomycetota bacterium]
MTVLALELFRSVPRYLAARAVGERMPGLVAGPLAPLRLVNRAEPELPGEGWGRVVTRLAGICGSDLATVSGRSSFYFSPLVSMPFVPGHEVVGELVDDVDGLAVGTRVVLDPVLACQARGVPPCPSCVAGATGRCDRVTVGHISPGLQTGYCADTGGGWSQTFLAHRSQLYPVPDLLPDVRAMLVEPLACAIHAALRGRPDHGDDVLVVGAGTVGILTLLALRELTGAGRITVVAKHRGQRDLARRMGATDVVTPGEAVGSLRRSSRAFRAQPERGPAFLLGGVDVAYECVGSSDSLDLALRTTRAGGRVVLAGLPMAGADLTPVWFRELDVVGAYASGTEDVDGGRRRTFDLAIELATEVDLDALVGAAYPLGSWREAIDHAMSAGRLGTAKVAFDPRED